MTSKGQEIFSTVPEKDYLSLFKEGKADYPEVMKFFEFKKPDLSKATRVPLTSIRFEPDRMPKELAERMQAWAVLVNLVAEYFQGDAEKTALWFTMQNPHLGNLSPRDMIRFGRYDKLLKFVVNALEENKA